MGFVDFFEFGFGLFVTGVLVGMVFDGELAVGLFDFIIGGVLRDAQYFIIITFRTHVVYYISLALEMQEC